MKPIWCPGDLRDTHQTNNCPLAPFFETPPRQLSWRGSRKTHMSIKWGSYFDNSPRRLFNPVASQAREYVTHPSFLCIEIRFIVRVSHCRHRNTLDLLETQIVHRDQLGRVIRHQKQSVHADMLEHRLADHVITCIGGESEPQVSVNSIGPIILQSIRPDLVV